MKNFVIVCFVVLFVSMVLTRSTCKKDWFQKNLEPQFVTIHK